MYWAVLLMILADIVTQLNCSLCSARVNSIMQKVTCVNWQNSWTTFLLNEHLTIVDVMLQYCGPPLCDSTSFWAILCHHPFRALISVHAWEIIKKCKSHKMLYFTHLPRSPWMDYHKIWLVGSSCRLINCANFFAVDWRVSIL